MNIQKILKQLNISFKKGPQKNIGIDMIGLNCPYCYKHGLSKDKSNHLGIFPNGTFSCWRCNESGNLFKLLKDLVKIDKATYDRLVNTSFHSEEETVNNLITKKLITKKENIVPQMPLEAKPIENCGTSIALQNWLGRRKFDLELLKKWGIYYCDHGVLFNHVIIPVYDKNGEYVGYQSTDVTGTSPRKYYFPPKFQAKNYLYGEQFISSIDSSANYVIVVEGVTDAWRIKDNVVATLGKQITDAQRNLLKEMNAILLFALDNDSIIDIKREVEWWRDYGCESYGIYLPEPPPKYDPDKYIIDFGYDAWYKLIKESWSLK